MIVLDEQLYDPDIQDGILKWYKGSVKLLHELRPNSKIKDRSIPSLLSKLKQSTFVTIDVWDFWTRIQITNNFCCACFDITEERDHEVPDLLRSLLSRREFNTKKKRMGKVIRVTNERIAYYTAEDKRIRVIEV